MLLSSERYSEAQKDADLRSRMQHSIRNDAEFFIPSSRLAQCSLLPYFSFPRSWRDFDQLNPAISILRNKNEFNTELKTYFIKILSSAFFCNRLFCPSCSSTTTIN